MATLWLHETYSKCYHDNYMETMAQSGRKTQIVQGEPQCYALSQNLSLNVILHSIENIL